MTSTTQKKAEDTVEYAVQTIQDTFKNAVDQISKSYEEQINEIAKQDDLSETAKQEHINALRTECDTHKSTLTSQTFKFAQDLIAI